MPRRSTRFARSGRALRIFRVYSPLSPRELQVLELVAAGRTNKEIAVQLDISNQTVKNHVSSILRKLAVNDRTQAVVYAMRRGWNAYSTIRDASKRCGAR